MANTFKNEVFSGANTTASTDMAVYTAPTSTTTVFLAKSIPIPVGSSFEYMAGNKIVMEATHSLIVKSSAANSLDTVASIMEIT